jgi:hypothetical protein
MEYLHGAPDKAIGKCLSSGKITRRVLTAESPRAVLKNMSSNNSFYMTMLSNCLDPYLDNTVGAFTTELARPIELNPEFRWEVSLCEFSCSAASVGEGSASNDFVSLIYCDLILPQPIRSSLARCLRSFKQIFDLPCEFIFDNTYYMPVESTAAFKNIRIEIQTLTGKRVPFESSEKPPRLVHFRRHRVWYNVNKFCTSSFHSRK